LALIVRNLRDLDLLEEPLMELGAGHAQVGVRPEHYPVLCRTMVETLRDGSGSAWSSDLEADWTELLARVSRIMMNGALRHAASSRGPRLP
jgi:nitric oxide dioxygenase